VATFLVHVTTGPENPTRAALAFLVAKAAVDEEARGLALPRRLVRLAVESDRVLTY
jgi:hypothetical protein